LGKLRDDGVRSPSGFPLLVQLILQDPDRVVLGFKQRFTVYLSFTSTLRPTFVHPHQDTTVLSV
jgi:hypothetical protein